MELLNNVDKKSSGKYQQISLLLKHLQKFVNFTKLNDTNKTYYPELTSIEKAININELLKANKTQLLILGDFLLFLIAISSKINTWIDKIDEMDSDIVYKYEIFLEKYFYLTEVQQTPEIPLGGESTYHTNTNSTPSK